jgi:hypothetical protein
VRPRRLRALLCGPSTSPLDVVKQRIVAFVAVPLVVLSSALAQETNPPHNYKPSQGYVANAETAIRIALAVWEPIYGKKQIDSEKPYRATLENGVWTVEGSLPPGWDGGVAIAEISASDGTILRVSHGR